MNSAAFWIKQQQRQQQQWAELVVVEEEEEEVVEVVEVGVGVVGSWPCLPSSTSRVCQQLSMLRLE